MPVLDLGGWPEKENIPVVYILWAKMAFPNDLNLRMQFAAARLADLITDAEILRENSRLAEDIPGEIVELLRDIGSSSYSSASEDSLDNQIINKGGYKTLLDAPEDRKILKNFVSFFYKGRVAGEILFLMKQMADARIGSRGASVNKAVHVMKTLRSDYYRNLNQPSHKRFFHESSRDSKSVAHLWAAYCLSIDGERYPEECYPSSEQSLNGFLNVAEIFRKFGTEFISHGQREPIIHEEKSLFPPEGVPPVSITISLPPLSEEQLQAIDNYQAPQST